MSIMIMLYNEKGAAIATDSRETKGTIYNDDKIKVYTNGDIIFGLTGLYSTPEYNYYDIFSEGLLFGKTIEEILEEKLNNGEKAKDILPIPEKGNITIYYARKNGEIGIYSLSRGKTENEFKDGEYIYYRNGDEKATSLYDTLVNTYKPSIQLLDLSDIQKMARFYVRSIIEIEHGYEKIKKTNSYVGGDIQIGTIKFEENDSGVYDDNGNRIITLKDLKDI